MIVIERDKLPPIIKKEIDSSYYINYQDLDLFLIKKLINETIEKNTYNTMDLISILRKNYQGSLKETIESNLDYKEIRFNCLYASKVLKCKLEKLGIKTYFLTYKSIGFSTDSGDKLIKEAHTSLLLPTKKGQEDYYIILDPGYRIPDIIGFYPKYEKNSVKVDNDFITISKTQDSNYPYTMSMKGYNRYSSSTKSFACTEFFNPHFETINPEDILFPASYELLEGYRLIRYSSDEKNRGFIKIMLLDEYLECQSAYKHILLTFQELKKFSFDEISSLLNPFALELSEPLDEILNNILFILKYHSEFLNTVINKTIYQEKIKQKSYHK